jgi:hypothetical protein
VKEIAMKTFIIATILSVGVLLRPEVAPAIGDMQIHNQMASMGAAIQTQPTANVLDEAEMKGAQGGGIFACHQELDASGDIYVSCCVDLWLFRVCFEVNWSAFQRMIPF